MNVLKDLQRQKSVLERRNKGLANVERQVEAVRAFVHLIVCYECYVFLCILLFCYLSVFVCLFATTQPFIHSFTNDTRTLPNISHFKLMHVFTSIHIHL